MNKRSSSSRQTRNRNPQWKSLQPAMRNPQLKTPQLNGNPELAPGSADSSNITPEWIEAEARFFGLFLKRAQIEQVITYLELLKKWNKKVNLTGIRSDQDAIRLHFLESFFAAERLPAGNLRVVDVGSGAGFPGLAMKIVRPGLRIVLLDSRKKKVLFQKEVIRSLKMQHIVAYPLRLREAAFFLQQADVVCWRGLKLEKKDFEVLKSSTPPHCLYLCFQGGGERTERLLKNENCEIEKIVIPRSETRTLLLARKKLA